MMQKKHILLLFTLICWGINAAQSEQPTNANGMSKQEKFKLQQERVQLCLNLQKMQHKNNSLTPAQKPPRLLLESYDVLIEGTDHSNQDICLSSSKHVTFGLSRASHSNFDVYIPLSVEKLTMHIGTIAHTNINIYAWHNPIIERILQKSEHSNISKVMLPIRKYTYHGLALATLAVGTWWFSSKND
jgi:hypothetical protein